MIEPGSGNLLDANADALVNTVNTDGVMGKGIALQFKKAFPENFALYERACRNGEVKVGEVFVCRTVLPAPRFILNFPTKKHWRNPSRLSYVRDGLVDLVAKVRDLSIRSLALPPLGCGAGGLDWAEVRPLIVQAFAALPEVRVLLFEPQRPPCPEAMPNRTPRPAMTPGRAAVLGLMARYLRAEYEESATLLEVQKLAYFLQVAGEPLRLDYAPHHYGPYADNLRQVLNRMEGHFTQGYGDGKVGPEYPIRLLPHAADEATAFVAVRPDTQARMDRVAALIDGFETPFGMELLATTHWVMTHEPSALDSLDAAVKAVKAWNLRKARIMGPEQIRAAWERLRETPWALLGTPA